MSSKTAAAATAATAAELAQKYQKKSERDHILDNPDTYIGSVETTPTDIWVYDAPTNSIQSKNIPCNFGLYKLFDEIITNSRDHYVRTEQALAAATAGELPVTRIDISVSMETGIIKITNNGTGIPVEMHPEHHIYIPELIFAHLRTSTNYDKTEKKIVGGKNGFGSKLTIVWSKWARVETVDHIRKRKYVQEYNDNLATRGTPTITASAVKPYTSLEFLPDYARLGFGAAAGLTPEMCALFHRRAFDIAAVTDKSVKVWFNGAELPVKTFKHYISMYIGDDKYVYEESGPRWEYAVALAPANEFTQVSFVNGIMTRNGGKHVEYVAGQIIRKISEYIEKKKKILVRPAAIKEQIMLFLRCDIENPAFDSQSKDCMTTAIPRFGSTCTVSDAFCEKIAKMGVAEQACSVTEARENRASAKKTDGKKTRTVRGIPNFIDANFAGTDKSAECTLILCEGLSAQAGVVSGLTSADRNYIGVFPLKGKILNVRGETSRKIGENAEVANLKRAMGLESGRTYAGLDDVVRNLRYGKIMFLTDSDLDGHHIKALCVNLFHCEWASLTKLGGFLSFMNTPILRARRGQQTLSFYNENEYETWKHQLGATAAAGWTIKYFKGLGTSTAAEFKEYFANKKVVDFVYTTESDEVIDKVFNKKRADERKTWLENYDKAAFLDTANPRVSYEDFIDKELVHFSVYDCERSIPNLMDGLKISLRKILYCAFKRRLTTEIKVAQFSGYVSEHSMYHHGENSLNAAIVGMAQNFVSSNNIHLLEPKGQFGTRLNGGGDSASERYIFTQLSPITRAIFPEADDAILTYLNDDGTMVEPEYYTPILPFILVNGTQGIGTGFSTSIPPYHPMDLVRDLRVRLSGAAPPRAEFTPYYEGFRGTIAPIEGTDNKKFSIKGCYERVDDTTIRITELPVGTWTMPYLTFLEDLIDPAPDAKTGKKPEPILKDMSNHSTENTVDICVIFPRGKLAELEARTFEHGVNGVEKTLKLATTLSTTNMHLFTAELKLKKYATIPDIITDYMEVRLAAYVTRKQFLLDQMAARLKKMSNKARYILEVLADTIDLRRKSAQQITEMLRGREFDELEDGGGYKYLVKMPMDSVSTENVEAILKEKAETEHEIEVLQNTTESQMWLNELAVFEDKYNLYKTEREALFAPLQAAPKKTIKARARAAAPKK